MVLMNLEFYLERHSVSPKTMAGFRRSRSAVDNVIDLVTSVQQGKHRKRISVALFLDVKGTCDNVTHEAILDALENNGMFG